MGMEMPSWYDIYHLDDNPNRPRENLEDVQQSVQYLQSIIQNETGMLKLQVPKAFTFDNFTQLERSGFAVYIPFFIATRIMIYKSN